jgi:aspartate racemase
MKTIGLIGGVSWVSTLDYYRIINSEVNRRLGAGNGARMFISSLNYEEVIQLNKADPQQLLGIVTLHAKKIEQAGADCLLFGANTMHRFAKAVQDQVGIPLIHIAEETGKAIRKKGFKTVSLLGTKFTMEMDFFKDKLAEQGIQALIPGAKDRDFIHETIFGELGRSEFKPATRARYVEIIEGMSRNGCEAAILGCTEIPMLVKEKDTRVPLLDTTEIHALAAVDFALG